MKRGLTFESTISSCIPADKSDIIAFALGNPANKIKAKLSKTNQNLLGSDMANVFITRHNHELQRCSQFYSLASIFNETSTKDKHRMKVKNIKRMYSTGRKHIIKLFVCCS